MREIDAGLLEYRTISQHPTATTATLRALPFVGYKRCCTILCGESVANSILKLEQVGLNLFNLHILRSLRLSPRHYTRALPH